MPPVSDAAAAAAAAAAERLRRIQEEAREREEAAKAKERLAAQARARAQQQQQAQSRNHAPPPQRDRFDQTDPKLRALANKHDAQDKLTPSELKAYTTAVKTLQDERHLSPAEAHQAVAQDPNLAQFIADSAGRIDQGATPDQIGTDLKDKLALDPNLGRGGVLPGAPGGDATTSSAQANPDPGTSTNQDPSAPNAPSGSQSAAGSNSAAGPNTAGDPNNTSAPNGAADPNNNHDQNIDPQKAREAAQAKQTMQAMVDAAVAHSGGKQPGGYCLGAVQDILQQGHFPGSSVPRLPEAHDFADYLNQGDNASKAGLQRLNIDNPYDAPPGAIVVVKAGSPGTSNPTAGDITIAAGNGRFLNDGEMSYGDPNSFKQDGGVVLGVYVPKGADIKGAQAVSGPTSDFSKNGLSADQLHQIMPDLPDDKVKQYLPFLNKAMADAKINTPDRAAAFLAQIAEESGQLKYMEEIASGAEYEGRADLGNTQPGDGERFKGRGPIQLTGRSNYEAAGKALGIDLVDHPERAADPDVAFRTAAWYWSTHNLNQLADQHDFLGITHAINGGENGESVREQYYQKALSVLGGGLGGGPVANANTPVGTSGSSSSYSSSSGGVSSGGYSSGGVSSGGSSGYTFAGTSNTPGDSTAVANFLSDKANSSGGSGLPANEVSSFAQSHNFDDMMFNYFLDQLSQDANVGGQVEQDPEFRAWAQKQPGMSKWKPGQPVPKKMVARFLMEKLGERGQAKGGGQKGLQSAYNQLLQKYQPYQPASTFKPAITG